MKATGVVRRIDELGRIVIPKEIRRTLRIKEGENLEIFIDDKENIVLKKFSTMSKIEDVAQSFADSIYKYIKHNIIITDTDTIIALSGSIKRKYLNKNISTFIESLINKRENIFEQHTKKINLIENDILEVTYTACPIIVHGDPIGIVIFLEEDERPVEEMDFQICQIAANFLSRHLED